MSYSIPSTFFEEEESYLNLLTKQRSRRIPQAHKLRIFLNYLYVDASLASTLDTVITTTQLWF